MEEDSFLLTHTSSLYLVVSVHFETVTRLKFRLVLLFKLAQHPGSTRFVRKNTDASPLSFAVIVIVSRSLTPSFDAEFQSRKQSSAFPILVVQHRSNPVVRS